MGSKKSYDYVSVTGHLRTLSAGGPPQVPQVEPSPPELFSLIMKTSLFTIM